MSDTILPTSAKWSEMTSGDLLDFLIREIHDEAIFSCLTSISVYAIHTRDDALIVVEKDEDCRKWAEFTASVIPEPYEGAETNS
jgi:hypothetical protein